MLQLLNTRIKEMLGEQMQKLRDRMDQLSENKKSVKTVKKSKGSDKATKDWDNDGTVETPKDEVWGSRAKAAAKSGKPFEESIEEGFPTVDDAKKAHAEKGTTGMKTGDKQKSSTGGEITKTATGLKHTAGKNYGGESAPKTPDSDKKSSKMKEGFPTVDDAKKAAAEKGTANMKVGQKQKSSTGGEITKTATGLKHTAGKNYGGQDAPKVPDSDKKAKKVKEGKLEETQFKHNVRFVNESLAFLINEDEEGKAKAITAASDIVNDFTSWMQRVGQYQTKAIIELADAIKADFGAAEAEAFKQSVAPALSATLETLTQQREAISSAVAVLAGEAAPEEPMGMEPGMGAEEPGMDMTAPDEMNPEPAGDEFAGADAAAGDGTTGRAMRESKFARKLAESHSIMSKLSK